MSKYKQITIRKENGECVDITPICIHRNKKPMNGYANSYKCKVRSEVVSCCGQAVGCDWYTPPKQQPQQLTLF